MTDDLSDDQVTAFIADPASIVDHETALMVIETLDAEISNIQAQVDAAQIQAGMRPLEPEREAWLRRACYAAAMRRNERHRVYQRDKELRGTKFPGQHAKDPLKAQANADKQARLKLEAEVRHFTKKTEAAKIQIAKMDSERLLQQARTKAYRKRLIEMLGEMHQQECYHQGTIADVQKAISELSWEN